jgi:hypothetical protein
MVRALVAWRSMLLGLYKGRFLCEIFSLEQWVVLLMFLGKLASLESPTIEIPNQPCVGVLEGSGKAWGIVFSEGGSQFVGLYRLRVRELVEWDNYRKTSWLWGVNWAVRDTLFCGIVAPTWGWFFAEIWNNKYTFGRNDHPLQSIAQLLLKDKCSYLCLSILFMGFYCCVWTLIFKKIYATMYGF